MEYSVKEWEGSQAFFGPKIKVDISHKHRLKAKFKSFGKEKSKLFLGLACYDENEKMIMSVDMNRKSACTVTSFTENTITIEPKPSDWIVGIAAGGAKSLGFYFDGNTQRFPDHIWTKDEKSKEKAMDIGVYSGFEKGELRLNIPLPDHIASRIQNNTTKICNHFAGKYYYSYIAAYNVDVPEEWTEYSGVIQGEAWGEEQSKFRIGTKYVSVVILANYNQKKEAQLMMKDLELSCVLFS